MSVLLFLVVLFPTSQKVEMYNLVLPDVPMNQRRLVVDLKKRALFVCRSDKPIFVFKKGKVVENHFWDEDVEVLGECRISAGNRWTPTPVGYFLGIKQGLGAALPRLGGGPLHNVIRFEPVGLGHHLIHAYDNVPLGRNASSGCVRMLEQDSDVLFDWVPKRIPIYSVPTTLPDPW
ncbi:MAG: L,D-transpeptidase [Patescibacteria group bacterium]